MSNMVRRRSVLAICSRILMDAAREAWLPDELWHRLKDEIRKLPVTKAQNIKSASWELDESYQSDDKNRFVCSGCHWHVYAKKGDARGAGWAVYCPHCGAIMRGGKKEPDEAV